MEFAGSAIFLIALLLPGFILERAYTKGWWRWRSPTTYRSFTEQIPTGILFSSILHVLWGTAAAIIGYRIDLQAVFTILTGSYGHEESHFESALTALTASPYKIFFYFSSLCLFAAIAGISAHAAVRGFAWDLRTRILRFNNPWFYFFEGEIAQFPDQPTPIDQEIAGAFVTTVVHHTNEDYVYKGVLEDYYFDKEGCLDRVVLSLAARRKLTDDRKTNDVNDPNYDENYYAIEGDYFVLKYSEMSTINVDYFFLTPDDEIDASENIEPVSQPGQANNIGL